MQNNYFEEFVKIYNNKIKSVIINFYFVIINLVDFNYKILGVYYGKFFSNK